MMYFLRKVFCEKGAMQLHGISETQIHREVSALMGQKFTDHATTVIHAELENGLLDYLKEYTVCSSTLAKSEYSSNCLVSKFDDGLATEVHLFPLIRELIGNIGSKTLMGRDFVTKNPGFLRDLWDLDSRVFQLLLGVDTLPISRYRSAREPRDRVLRAVTEHHQALFNKLSSPSNAEQYGDLSDVSDIFKARLKDWTSAGITIASCASANTALLWAANVNSAPVAFWLVWYISQHGDLLEGIRGEIRDYIRYEQTENGNQLQFDVPALLNDCRLLNATYLETLRLEAHTFSFKLAKEDCIITEAPVGRTCSSQRRSYAVKKGDFVCVHHGSHQTDERYFPNAQKFDPFRFLNGDKPTGSNRSEYGDMYVFSGGKGECKGRSFARLEILLVASYLIHFWDIDPVTSDLDWDWLGRISTSGAHIPQKDVKVKMRKRFDGKKGGI